MKKLLIIAIAILFIAPFAIAEEGRWAYDARGNMVWIDNDGYTSDFGASARREREANQRIRNLERENERLRQQQNPEPDYGSQEWHQHQQDEYLKNAYGIDPD